MENQNKKILIVEDNAQDKKIIRLNLTKHGYKNLLFASTGEEGVAKAKSEKPDLIIVDINLPQMNGVEVNIALKNDPATRPIPVLFNTNLLNTSAVDPGIEPFVSKGHFVAKSTLQKDLIKAIKTILGS